MSVFYEKLKISAALGRLIWETLFLQHNFYAVPKPDAGTGRTQGQMRGQTDGAGRKGEDGRTDRLGHTQGQTHGQMRGLRRGQTTARDIRGQTRDRCRWTDGRTEKQMHVRGNRERWMGQEGEETDQQTDRQGQKTRGQIVATYYI